MPPESAVKTPFVIQLALWIVLLQSIPAIFGSVVHVFWEHGREADWTAHQQSHAIWSGGQGTALALLMVLLAWIPFRRRELWSWYALLIASLGQYGSLALGYWMTGWKSHLNTAPILSIVFLVILLAALALSKPSFK